MLRIVGILVLSLALVACGSTQNTSTEGSTSGVTADRIDVSELSIPLSGLSAYDLVQQYNANWLQKRGPSSINNPVPIKVYVDNTGSAFGTVSSLRNLNARNVDTIEYFDAQEAQFEFGLGNVAGVIYVQTKASGG